MNKHNGTIEKKEKEKKIQTNEEKYIHTHCVNTRQ